MWILRVLNGPQAGQTFEINKSQVTLGRSPNCDIVIQNPNISKAHIKIEIQGEQIKLTDLNSRNGSYFKGVKFKSQILTEKERVSLHQIFIDFIKKAPEQSMAIANINSAASQQGQGYSPQELSLNPSYNDQLSPDVMSVDPEVMPNSSGTKNSSSIKDMVEDYINDVMLKGVYKLAEWVEFKWVIAGFIAAFVFLVTTLSAVPLMKILRDSIQQESRLRAKTISRTLADINRSSITSGISSAVSVDFVEQEAGVKDAYIIKTDGTIIAPPNKSGFTLDESAIQQARIDRKESVTQVDNNTIVSITPIKIYDQNGNEMTAAFSVVRYNMGTLSLNDERTLSLYIQTLFIALVIGSLIYFFLLKLVEYPIASLNKQLNKALSDNTERLQHEYKYEELQNLISNINSALGRITSPNSEESNLEPEVVDRTKEMENIVQLVGFPAICISAVDETITALNQSFEDRVGMSALDLLGAKTDKIIDQALKLSIQDLITQAGSQPQQILTNTLDFSDATYDITLQPIWEQSNAAYYLIVMLPGYEEGVA